MSDQELRAEPPAATMREVDRSFAIALLTLGGLGLFIAALTLGSWTLGSMPTALSFAIAAISGLG